MPELGLRIVVAALGSLALSIAGAIDARAEPGPCAERASSYEGYRLRNVDLKAFPPLWLLQTLSLGDELPPAGSIFSIDAAARARDAIDSKTRGSSGIAEAPVSVTVVMFFISECDDTRRELDLSYSLFMTRLTPSMIYSLEFLQEQRNDPASASGVVPRGPQLSLEPSAYYDEADRFVPGARLALSDPDLQGFVEGGSSEYYTNLAAGLFGESRLDMPNLWRGAYGAGYRYEVQPQDHEKLRQWNGFGWLSGATQPSTLLAGPLRYGAQLERGDATSQLESPGFERESDYTALKLVVGASGGRGIHDYALSIGGQVGAVEGLEPAWFKLLLDSSYGIRIVPDGEFFDHRSIDVDARLGAGWLEPIGQRRAPQNERFFGGARPHPFTEIPDWSFRSAPVNRGFSDNRLVASLTGSPSGREYYASLNLTVGMIAWRVPLIPPDLYRSDEFAQLIEAEKGTARSGVESYHESHDPAIRDVERAAAAIEPDLASLQSLVSNLDVPDSLSDAHEECQEMVAQTIILLTEAKQSRVYSFLRASVGAGLPTVIEACGENLNDQLPEPSAEIHGAIERLARQLVVVDDVFSNRIDRATVDRRTNEDFALADRALTAFVKEINLYSIDPVVLFDVTYVGPSSDRFIRYAAGGGLRVTLASHASFTAAYAANLNRGHDEPAGAFVFELTIHDLIR